MIQIDFSSFLADFKALLESQSIADQEANAATYEEILRMLNQINSYLAQISELLVMIIGCIVLFFIFRFMFGYFSSLFRG
ncbi:MAG: hypothetical protein LBM93_09480 [Oscillospiraceae bacterium]|jgi:hypothetical protein|nr:hypothetical protein [Oscillospiraceae bacterium]